MMRVVDNVAAVAAADHRKLVVQDSTGARAAGAGPGAVVLQSTLDPIKQPAVVGVNLIELPDRKVGHEFPVLGTVIRNRDAAVLANPDSIGIFGIHPHGVVIAV